MSDAIVQEPIVVSEKPHLYLLEMDRQELFALTVLLRIKVHGLVWDDDDPDKCELEFRTGKRSLAAKTAELIEQNDGKT